MKCVHCSKEIGWNALVDGQEDAVTYIVSWRDLETGSVPCPANGYESHEPKRRSRSLLALTEFINWLNEQVEEEFEANREVEP